MKVERDPVVIRMRTDSPLGFVHNRAGEKKLGLNDDGSGRVLVFIDDCGIRDLDVCLSFASEEATRDWFARLVASARREGLDIT